MKIRVQQEFFGPGAEADTVLARKRKHFEIPPWLVGGRPELIQGFPPTEKVVY
jgi:hypothetical protein